MSRGVWQLVVWYTGTDVFEKRVAPTLVFYPKETSNTRLEKSVFIYKIVDIITQKTTIRNLTAVIT
jgi:hypothetical protein